MSLINEALKKAQRMQHEETATVSAAPYPVGRHAARRETSSHSPNLVLMGTGALVIVVLSVFFTVYLINRPSDSNRVAQSTATPPAATPAPTPAPDETNTPAIVPPKVSLPTTTPPAAVATSPAANATTVPSTAPAQAPAPESANATPPAGSVASTNVAPPAATTTSTSAPAATPPTAAPASLGATAPDERVAAFVDAVRVTGIRSSGADSRVLMNERVYRVNDVVERTLGVRLIKAAADSLTFSDARGVTYVKNF
jgi:hypothetical protein